MDRLPGDHSSPVAPLPALAPFRQRLRDAGVVEEQNLGIGSRTPARRLERLLDPAAKLVRLKTACRARWAPKELS